MAQEVQKVILILADISGYTRFMTQNKTTLVHSQVIITELIKAIVKQVEIPLVVSELEGDAVFIYGVKETDEAAWQADKKRIGVKLFAFFEAFVEKLLELSQSNICECNACKSVERLKLKIIVHSGEAVFTKIGRLYGLSGVDVIIAHRLLKNSVESDQYILMTEEAYRDIEFPGLAYGAAFLHGVHNEHNLRQFGKLAYSGQKLFQAVHFLGQSRDFLF